MYDKTQARDKFRVLRQKLARQEKDEAIFENALRAFGGFESYFVYLSFRTEVKTDKLIEELILRKKIVCAPRVFGKEMRSVRLTQARRMGAFGISEPVGEEEFPCAVSFTPLLAVDKEGFRLGYGGGYYDRYFALHPDVLRVGLAYAGQMTDLLPREETDLPLDALVTECGVTYFETGRLCGGISK